MCPRHSLSPVIRLSIRHSRKKIRKKLLQCIVQICLNNSYGKERQKYKTKYNFELDKIFQNNLTNSIAIYVLICFELQILLKFILVFNHLDPSPNTVTSIKNILQYLTKRNVGFACMSVWPYPLTEETVFYVCRYPLSVLGIRVSTDSRDHNPNVLGAGVETPKQTKNFVPLVQSVSEANKTGTKF